MKNKVLSLTKVFLRSSFQNIETANNQNKQSQKSKAMIILYVFIFAYLAGIVGFFSAIVIIYATQFFIAGYYISIYSSVIAAIIYSIADYFLPNKLNIKNAP